MYILVSGKKILDIYNQSRRTEKYVDWHKYFWMDFQNHIGRLLHWTEAGLSFQGK